jgi:hypothetical protein
MGCHNQVWNRSPMLAPVRNSYFSRMPVAWNRAHDLPDFVYFDHSVHVMHGVGCASCLTSSFTVALSVHAVRVGRSRLEALLLGASVAMAMVFLVLKTTEYAEHFEEGIYPGARYAYSGYRDMASGCSSTFITYPPVSTHFTSPAALPCSFGSS